MSTAWYAWRGFSRPAPFVAAAALSSSQQRTVSALTRLLYEDGLAEPERWASAIVRSSPTDDLGYIALVTAQIRRESHFLAPDLEWIYKAVIPELAHELGLPDPIWTIGPMQVQRRTLEATFERSLGRPLEPGELDQRAYDLESGVAACVAILDRIVVEYIPDRALRGWVHNVGAESLFTDVVTLASDWNEELPEGRYRLALEQKMLSDLMGVPLALDGVDGPSTREVQSLFGAISQADLRGEWERRFGGSAPTSIRPHLTHEPRVAFIIADFNAGPGACRVAALQSVLNDLLGTEMVRDGLNGPDTRAAVRLMFERSELDESRRDDFLALIDKGHKRRWVMQQALQIAHRSYRAKNETDAPKALVPDRSYDSTSQRVKGIDRTSVEVYTADSAAFFESYLRRLLLYTGTRAVKAQ